MYKIEKTNHFDKWFRKLKDFNAKAKEIWKEIRSEYED
jgi:putative component of toxin-antitoxin plasmid stabilization module